MEVYGLEEKKAIKGLEWSQQQMRLGNLPDYDQGHYADIRIILNLIKKQSKEIELLKEENEKYKNPPFFDEENYTENDKIKAKIEEVSNGTYDAKIVLQSLLEKE